MTVSNTWTNPSAGGALDLSAGAVVTEANWDAMVSNQLWLGGATGYTSQVGQTYTADAQNTTSNTQTAIPNTAVLMTTTGGTVLVFGSAAVLCTSTAQLCTFSLAIDGTPVALARIQFPVANTALTVSIHYNFTTVSSALHTFAMYWGVAGGATLSTDSAIFRALVAVEIRR